MNRQEVLASALAVRNDEILTYQINIDNYSLAIDKINANHSDDSNLLAFRDELQVRLEHEQFQQARARIIRDVIADQLAELQTVKTEAS